MSGRVNWVPAPPPPEASMPPPQLGPWGGQNDRQNYRSLFSGGMRMQGWTLDFPLEISFLVDG